MKRPPGNDGSDRAGTEPAAAGTNPVSRGPNGGAFVGDRAFGVPLAPRGGGSGGGTSVDVTNSGSGNVSVVQNISIDNRTYVDYVTNVSRANGWYHDGRPSCGDVDVWHDYQCGGGLSVSVGFGGGFSFGFFYGSSCRPLCSSWCNPWWDGYATYWSCRPSPYGWWSPWRTCWDPCRPYWWHSYRCGPCPWPGWTPVYAYSPIIYSGTVYTAAPIVVSAPPPLPSPGQLWRELGEGYDHEAEDGFRRLADVDPLVAEWPLGVGLARAFRGDVAWGSENFRQAFALDPSIAGRVRVDARLSARLVELENRLSGMVQGHSPSPDALLVVAASQALRGDLARAYFTATTAQREGDRSAGTAAFIAWLDDELRGQF